MARQRVPLAKAELTGAAAKDPQRYRDRSEPKTSGKKIGIPPSWFTKEQKDCWKEFVGELPWLIHEDRGALEAAAIARARLRTKGVDLSAADLNAARLSYAVLGATPVDRQKVGKSEEKEDADPFAQFVQ